MYKKRYELVTHTFKGGRFDDHGIDVDVLPDLITYKNLLIETAKELWRIKHPDRHRLPKNFEDSLSLKFYEIRSGSATVPLIREFETEATLFPVEYPSDELDEAVDLIAETIHAVSSDQPLPASLPKSIISSFAQYGKTLRDDESIELRPARKNVVAHYSLKERNRLANFAQAEYEDVVELLGEIRAADLDGRNFSLRLADGSRVPGKFLAEQETAIVEALKDHASLRLHVKGRAEFFAEGVLKRIVSIASLFVQPAEHLLFDPGEKPIWKVVEEITASIPDKEWTKLPSDLSKNLDHYLFGTPKQTE